MINCIPEWVRRLESIPPLPYLATKNVVDLMGDTWQIPQKPAFEIDFETHNPEEWETEIRQDFGRWASFCDDVLAYTTISKGRTTQELLNKGIVKFPAYEFAAKALFGELLSDYVSPDVVQPKIASSRIAFRALSETTDPQEKPSPEDIANAKTLVAKAFYQSLATRRTPGCF